jgi:hypothetical protein
VASPDWTGIATACRAKPLAASDGLEREFSLTFSLFSEALRDLGAEQFHDRADTRHPCDVVQLKATMRVAT